MTSKTVKDRILETLAENKAELNEELVAAALIGSALGLLTLIVVALAVDTIMEPTSLKNRLKKFANFINGKNSRLLKKVKALVDEDKELYDIILNGTTKRGFKPYMRNKFETRLKQLLPAEDFRDIMDLAARASEEVRKQRVNEESLSEGFSFKKVSDVKTMIVGDPDEWIPDVRNRDREYLIINNKTKNIVGKAKFSSDDYFGHADGFEVELKDGGATRTIKLGGKHSGDPQSAFNKFMKGPKY
jgi:hypothetical protein